MGKRIALSNGRRLVDDVIRMANQTPLAGLSGDFDFSHLAKYRRLVKPKISWNVLFMKAYAQACRKMPELRQGYTSFPWPHIYQHDDPVCMITIAREYRGEERLFFARFVSPDYTTLQKLQAKYDRFRKAPVESIRQFRHQIKFAKAPSLARRMAWWMLFNVWPEKRATHMGTYGMSISGHNGVYGSMHLGPNTTTLGVDPMPRKGQCRLVLTFDHRVLDGTPATRAFSLMQQMMDRPIHRELAALAGFDYATGLPLESPPKRAAA